jgi:hypothetical protein
MVVGAAGDRVSASVSLQVLSLAALMEPGDRMVTMDMVPMLITRVHIRITDTPTGAAHITEATGRRSDGVPTRQAKACIVSQLRLLAAAGLPLRPNRTQGEEEARGALSRLRAETSKPVVVIAPRHRGWAFCAASAALLQVRRRRRSSSRAPEDYR